MMKKRTTGDLQTLSFTAFGCLLALAWIFFIGRMSDGSWIGIALAAPAIAVCWLGCLVICRAKVKSNPSLLLLAVITLVSTSLYFQPWTDDSRFKAAVKAQVGRSLKETQQDMSHYPGGETVPFSGSAMSDEVDALHPTHLTKYELGLWEGWIYSRDGMVVGAILTGD